MKKLLIILSIVLFWGCASFEKKHYKAITFFNQNENLAAEYCSGKFPVIPKFIKGDPIVVVDTTYIDVPIEVDCPDGTKVKETKKIPYTKKTVTVTDTIIKPDKAKERVLEDQRDNYKQKYLTEVIRADNAEKERNDYKKKYNTYRVGIFSFLGLGVMVLIFKLFIK